MTVHCILRGARFAEEGSAYESVLQVDQRLAKIQNVSVADDYPQKEGNHESETNRDRCVPASLLLLGGGACMVSIPRFDIVTPTSETYKHCGLRGATCQDEVFCTSVGK